jgi:hypothetical protein
LWERFAAPAPSHPALDPLWRELQTRWSDDDLHARFLDTAASVRGLDVAAARYRQVLAERDTDVHASDGLKRAALLAERLHMARAMAEPPTRGAKAVRFAGAFVAGLVLMIAAWMLILAIRNSR